MFPSHLELMIRRATRDDAWALRRVAERDSRRVPNGDVLVAELGGELVAAVPVDGGNAVADPFRPTAEVVRVLELRAEALRRHRPGRLRADALPRTGLRRALRAGRARLPGRA